MNRGYLCFYFLLVIVAAAMASPVNLDEDRGDSIGKHKNSIKCFNIGLLN